MKHNQSYEDFVLRQCRLQRTPRTLLEAYRDGEYGYTIHLFKDDLKQAKEFAVSFFVWFMAFALGFVMVYSFLVWLGVL